MSDHVKSYYQTCREMAGMTQEEASVALNVSTRQLARYEAGENVPADEYVDAMVTAYGTPMLAWWHLKHRSSLGKHLPDVILPQSDGDMCMHIAIADDEIGAAWDLMRRLRADGKFTPDEYSDLSAGVSLMETISGRMLSAATYAKQYVLPALQGKAQVRMTA